MKSKPRIRGMLLDIEGTTTPIAFVHEVLFPYARSRVKSYLAMNSQSSDTIADLAQLRKEHALDVQQGLEPPALIDRPQEAEIDSIVDYVHWQIDHDRKSTGLKSLQGKIWTQGYHDGTLRAPVFPDVLPALERWHEAGLKIAIFSSGSIWAQKLLFAHTEAGDLTQYLCDYFDTTTGSKKTMESYGRIATQLGLLPAEILFISDVVSELEAARATGLQTLLCVRPGNQPDPGDHTHERIFTFDEIAKLKR